MEWIKNEHGINIVGSESELENVHNLLCAMAESSNEQGNCIKPDVSKRYFIVFYIGTTGDGNKLTGQTQFTATSYIVARQAKEQIMESLTKYEVHSVVITGIIELSAQDYEIWNS